MDTQDINSQLPTQQLDLYNELGVAKGKSIITAVVLILLFGMFGAHKFYQNKTGEGVLYLVFSWTLIPLFFALIDLFFIAGQIRWANERAALATQLLQDPKLIRDVKTLLQAQKTNRKIEIVLKLIFGILLSWILYVSGTTLHERLHNDEIQFQHWLK